MALGPQLVDVVVGVVLAVVIMTLLNAIVPPLGTRFGVVVATMYYFSRNPWGSRDDDRINDRIDRFYDEYLPFGSG